MNSASDSSIPDRTDVVVVGAGPTGLALARALADRGIAFVVVDRAAAGGNTSRAAVVHARTLEVLEPLSVTDELIRLGVVVPRFTIRDRDKTLLSVSFGDLPTAYPYTLMVPQSTTEQVLEDRLVALGSTVHREQTVTAVEPDTDGVTVSVRRADQSVSRVRARFVVGADGMHSVVREDAGIAFVGDRYAQSFVLADVHMDWPLPRDEVHLFFSASGLVVVAPLPDDRFRIVATLDEAPEQPVRDDIQALLDSRGPLANPAKVRERRGPVFLAGDAAHVHSPAGGQGMNTGIQDAVVLAGLLADVLDGRAGDEHLNTYESTRRPVAMDVVATTHRITRAATARSPVSKAVRNAVLGLVGQVPSMQRRLVMNLSELATDPGRRSDRQRWIKVRLEEPSAAGFVLLAASSGRWRLPLALPRARRRAILARLHAAGTALRRDERVARADVFEGFLRPPGQPSRSAEQDAPEADFDAVLLIETTCVETAEELFQEELIVGLRDELGATATNALGFAGANVRRIAQVDHERQGVFLFNYFSAADVDTNLEAWQYTAGWFQDETGLNNSTVLQPGDATVVPYQLVNHCRWDRLRDVLPALVVKRSFGSFVLRVFDDHGVVPRPILYRLHRPG